MTKPLAFILQAIGLILFVVYLPEAIFRPENASVGAIVVSFICIIAGSVGIRCRIKK